MGTIARIQKSFALAHSTSNTGKEVDGDAQAWGLQTVDLFVMFIGKQVFGDSDCFDGGAHDAFVTKSCFDAIPIVFVSAEEIDQSPLKSVSITLLSTISCRLRIKKKMN